MNRKFVLLLVLVSLVYQVGYASVFSGRSTGNSPRAVVEQLFVQRVNRPETFNYFTFWGLDAVKSYFDESLLREYTKFKEECEKQYAPWGQWNRNSQIHLGTFPIYARDDPLTMCEQKPLKITVIKLEENNTSAIYKIKYLLQGNAATYFSESFVILKKKNEKWLVSSVATVQYDNEEANVYSFVSQLNLLREKLRGKN